MNRGVCHELELLFTMDCQYSLSLVAASLTIQYWTDKIDPAVWVAIFWVVIVGISIFGVKGYGYGESLFSVIKVVAIAGLYSRSYTSSWSGNKDTLEVVTGTLHSSTGFMVFVILWLTWLSVIPELN